MHAPGKRLGAMFRVPMSMLSKAKSFSFQGIELHAYDDVDKGQVYRKADLARKGKNNNWKKSYATLEIVADVYIMKSFRTSLTLSCIKLATLRVQIRGKDKNLLK